MQLTVEPRNKSSSQQQRTSRQRRHRDKRASKRNSKSLTKDRAQARDGKVACTTWEAPHRRQTQSASTPPGPDAAACSPPSRQSPPTPSPATPSTRWPSASTAAVAAHERRTIAQLRALGQMIERVRERFPYLEDAPPAGQRRAGASSSGTAGMFSAKQARRRSAVVLA